MSVDEFILIAKNLTVGESQSLIICNDFELQAYMTEEGLKIRLFYLVGNRPQTLLDSKLYKKKTDNLDKDIKDMLLNVYTLLVRKCYIDGLNKTQNGEE